MSTVIIQNTIFIFQLIACHLIGDYVLQVDYIARTKGENKYHLFVHCFLYTVPFAYLFSRSFYHMPYVFILTTIIFISHWSIDALKCRTPSRINYLQDQVFHYIVLLLIDIDYLYTILSVVGCKI